MNEPQNQFSLPREASITGGALKSKLLSVTLSRRSTLKLIGLGAASLYLPGCSTALKKEVANSQFDIQEVNPIDRYIGNLAPRSFSGDYPDATHKLLWDKEAYIASHGGLPKPSESVPLVIVGGGISGLCSAYLLRDLKPIVLERATRFGGCARGESWNGLDYSIGAAYFMEPDKGSAIEKLIKELGVDKIAKRKETEDPIVLNEKRFYKFWDGETDPKKAEQFRRLQKYFKDTLEGRNGLTFPEIPARTNEQRALFKSLDRISFKEHMEKVAKGSLHPHIQAALEHFCWSSFGAAYGDISAAAGLNFYAAEFGNLMVTPGGNSGVAEKFLEKISQTVPESHFRTRSIVYDVSATSDGAVVSYQDAKGVPQAIHAKAVIMACPQFVVGKILRNIELERKAAIEKLEYHAYVMANVLLNKPVKDDFYDLYLIGDGTIDSKNIEAAAEKQRVTDVVHGTYAHLNPSRSILTLYRGMPFSGGHTQLLEEHSYNRFRSDFEAQIYESILGLVGAKKEDVADIRLSRWGHPLPVASTGLFSSGVLDQIQKPFQEKVFFVDQDNWALPAFETSLGEALYWAPKVRKAIV